VARRRVLRHDVLLEEALIVIPEAAKRLSGIHTSAFSKAA
jgi:hypothetical protein